jgi:hypothetical protein
LVRAWSGCVGWRRDDGELGPVRGELDQRIGKVLASRTYRDLADLTADIPSELAGAQSVVPARRSGVGKKAIWGASAAAGGTAFMLFEALVANTHIPVTTRLIVGAVPGAFAAGLLAVLLTLIAWVIDRNSGRQRSKPLPPAAGNTAAHHPAPADPAGEPRRISRRRLGPGAEAARNRLSRSPLTGPQSP